MAPGCYPVRSGCGRWDAWRLIFKDVDPAATAKGNHAQPRRGRAAGDARVGTRRFGAETLVGREPDDPTAAHHAEDLTGYATQLGRAIRQLAAADPLCPYRPASSSGCAAARGYPAGAARHGGRR